ncbi:hypothetical protein M427DRAFT_384132 [Gonapodya prolifera JEL478]|uniref:Uncharacterized protein n=1 Tax=Gonapodya prolifera (strain JEL478) TaxID=1344416 RepID=A0A139A8T3_GONPJ|nr:hypothetical protein M427DRAFT_384132 [Gonapodya prolifera JEL478]|eukprot:KXS13212.1 hypothetical protein M427DRAFT_384132 [Gonapodya prolifera JEL478]
MDDTKVTLPDTKWDQILGVHHVSTVFKLPRLTQESERAIRNAIEGGAGAPDELFKIAEESKKWCFPDIEKRASTRLQELLLNTESPETTLATTSLETLSTLVETMEPASHFALVRRYIDVRAAAKDPVPPEAVSRLWSRVPFTSLSVTDLESAYSDATVPVVSVVDATSRALLLQPSQGPTLSYELFNAALEPSASMTLGMSQSQVYRLVREYNAAHPELDEPRRDQLWNKVRFVELSVEELEDAYGSTDVPRAPVVAAMFSRLRTGPAPSPSPSPLPPNPAPTAVAYAPGSYDPLMKPVPATPSPPPAMSYGHQHTPSYDFGNPPTGAAAKLSFDPYTPVPVNGDAPKRVSEDKKRFPY